MTASDLPTVTGIPNNGGEGFRFLGYPVYDGLVNWDYSHVNQTADATPGLFQSWTIDPKILITGYSHYVRASYSMTAPHLR